jgi:hypothetical protein
MNVMKKTGKSYLEAMSFTTFEDRFEYLRLNGSVCEETFGSKRYLNQLLYRDPRWKRIRREVIIRDDGCDLADPNYEIVGNIYIHHINPITIDDILNNRIYVFDLDNLICTSFNTHNAIHYGSSDILQKDPVIRSKNDTCPWR